MIIVDYLTLLLVNMVAGLALAAAFVARGMDSDHPQSYAAGFGVVGLVAMVFGGHICMTWPLPGSFNIAFGEMSVAFGAAFVAVAVAVARGWRLVGAAVYTFFVGAGAVVVGLRIADLGMSKVPWLTCVGFCLSGLGGMLLLPVSLVKARALRYVAAAVLALAALVWVATAYPAYWAHLSGFSDYQPPPVKLAAPAPQPEDASPADE